ncbi:Protein MEN-8 [Linum grandiflorum]
MASSSKYSSTLLVLIAVALAAAAVDAQGGSSCPVQLSNLNVCAPFVVPGAAAPSTECCSAIKSVQTDCLCSTLQITARLPSLCSLPTIACPLPS